MGGYKNIRPEDNPKPFKKGQTGNPMGGSKRRRAIKKLNDLIIEKLGSEDGDTGRIEEVFEKLIEMSLKGDMGAIKEVLERVYGKVKQDVEVKGDVKLTFGSDYENL